MTTKTEKQVVSGFHRPVCVKDNCELRPEKNGVGVLDTTDGKPYELFDADLWKCPKCGFEIVGGFGFNPIASHFDEHFELSIASYKRNSQLIENNG